jgi:1,4-dihydroxy-2-naphthoate octaprenyltransferase
LLTGGYIGILAVWLTGAMSFWALMPILSLPLGLSLMKRIWHGTAGPELNHLLAATAALSLIFSLLLALGLVLSIHLPG